MSLKNIGRADGRSAVASAAYISGTRLRSYETGLSYNYRKKKEVVFRHIFLPEHAPEKYQDREILWNAVQKIEKRSDARLARMIVVALPNEFDRNLQIQVLGKYVKDQFVDRGMCADVAIHDKGDGNPHAHIMLTTRGFDPDGSWSKKERSTYKLDEDGNKIPLIDPKTGLQKVRIRKGKGAEKLWERRSVPSNDWNKTENVEIWRKAWADLCNRYLKPDHQIDHRSFKRQGLDLEPTIHEGYAARQMAYSLCEWFMQTYGDWNYQNKPFVMPEPTIKKASVEKAAEEKKEQELIKKAEEIAIASEKIDSESRKKQARKAASQRVKSEAETRYMIDEQLRKVGWEADTENLRYSKGTRPAKGRCIAIAEWPTDSSVGNKGYADYALFVDLRMVAVIEAKAIHKDIPSVIDYQCKEYSRNIRSEDKSYQIGIWGNYKVPFTFATNGRSYLEQYDTKSGVWCLDLRLPYNAPKALHGWISPTGIMELLEKDIAAGNQGLIEMPYDLLRDIDGLNLREYQLKAIRAAEQAIIDGQQNILLAMATGTGKTRTVLGMIYRFLKTGRFRRILFLVDRNALGEQATDVFKEVKLEDLMTLDDIYNIKGLDDKTIDP